MKLDLIPLLALLIGAGGVGTFFRDVVEAIWKLITGVSARETKRRIDVVQQRDEAYSRLEAERDRGDREARNSQALQLTVTELQMELIRRGVPKSEIPQMPDLERTVPRSRVLRDEDKER